MTTQRLPGLVVWSDVSHVPGTSWGRPLHGRSRGVRTRIAPIFRYAWRTPTGDAGNDLLLHTNQVRLLVDSSGKIPTRRIGASSATTKLTSRTPLPIRPVEERRGTRLPFACAGINEETRETRIVELRMCRCRPAYPDRGRVLARQPEWIADDHQFIAEAQFQVGIQRWYADGGR